MILKRIFYAFLLCLMAIALKAQINACTFYKAKNEVSKHEWILLLPGSSGLTIFEDSTFYNRKAEYLIQKGFDVILLDYKEFYQTSTSLSKPKGSSGQKISWVVKQVIQLAKDKKEIDFSNNGHLIGWSLAGEGVFNILKDTTFITENKITSAALFYPSNNEKLEITTSIPLLIQIGQSDKTVIADMLKKQIKNFEKIKFLTYPYSFHGFDIETITKPKVIKFPPIVGKKHTFLYNKDATEKAYLELINFLTVQ